MGLPIYMDYYTIHDDNNNKMGFVPRQGSSKEQLRTGERPTRFLQSTDPEEPPVSVWSWIISGLLVLAFMCIWVQVIVGTLSDRRSKVNPGSLCCVAIGFTVAFAAIVYFKLQPIINDFIIDDEEQYDGGMY